MGVSIRVFDSLIVLDWDGELPRNVNPENFEDDKPDFILNFWKIIGPFAQHSPKLTLQKKLKEQKFCPATGFPLPCSRECFVIQKSAQNFRRLKRQFPGIQVSSGHSRMHSLKKEYEKFQAVVDLSSRIKKGDFDHLPLETKMPPLGLYQERGVKLLLNIPSLPLFADCGLGKTYMVLVSSEIHIKGGVVAPGKTLIAGKLATLDGGWIEDAEKFTGLKIVNLWIGPVAGKNAKKKKIEMFRKRLKEPADIFLINHEGIRNYESILTSVGFEKIVIDESTILKNHTGTSKKSGSQFGKSLMKISKKAKWRVIMSGTPAPNSAQDLWGQMNFLDPHGFLLEASLEDFQRRWMHKMTFDKRAILKDQNKRGVWQIKPNAVDEIASVVNRLAYRVKIRDQLKSLPELTEITRKLDMSKSQIKNYKEMKVLLETELEGEVISASNKLAQMGKLRQITGGFLMDHQMKPQPHPIKKNPKMEELDSIIEDELPPGEKLIVFCQYRFEISSLEKRYKHLGAVSYYGENKNSDNLKNLKNFRENKNPRIIIMQPQSTAHGINLTMCHYMVFYSINYSAEYNYQAIARIKRAGQKHPMVVYYLICKGSIDEAIKKTLTRKTKNQEKLIDQDELSEDILKEMNVG